MNKFMAGLYGVMIFLTAVILGGIAMSVEPTDQVQETKYFTVDELLSMQPRQAETGVETEETPEPAPEPVPASAPEPETSLTPEPESAPTPEPVAPEIEIDKPDIGIGIGPVISIGTPVPPITHTISLPEGGGIPGCEETDQCYTPSSLSVFVGDTVVWNNDDVAAHTVTSGKPAEGPDGIFDSSLFMSGNNFEYTFENPGTVDYFCLVHPWMVGQVVVNEVKDMDVIDEVQPEPEIVEDPLPETPDEPTVEMGSVIFEVSVAKGSGVPGCEETNECYLPPIATINFGDTVSWFNDDSAAHTVTSGSPGEGPDGIFDSGLFVAGATFDHTFEVGGTIDYFCMVHPWMAGQIIIE